MSIGSISKFRPGNILRPDALCPTTEIKVEAVYKRKASDTESMALDNNRITVDRAPQVLMPLKLEFLDEKSSISVKKRRIETNNPPSQEFCADASFEENWPLQSIFSSDVFHEEKSPLTPMKQRKGLFENPLAKTCKQIAAGKLQRNGQVYELVTVTNARGDHKQLYSLLNEKYPLVQGYANCEVRVKALHEVCLNRSSPKATQEFWKKSCEHQLMMQNSRLPVLKTLNSAFEDGYEIEPYIRHAVDPKIWACDTPLDSLDKGLVFILEQARDIFTKVAKGKLPLDLSPKNFRFDDYNRLFIIDSYVEVDPLDSFLGIDNDVAAQCWLKGALVDWANGNFHVYALLTEDIAKMNTADSKALATFG